MTLQVYLLITIPIILFVPLLISRKAYKLKKKEYASLLEMDITLEEMENSEKRIENFIKDNKLKEPSSIEEFSKILNVEAGGTEQGLKSQAYIEEDKVTGKSIVKFKLGLSDVEKNFIFAHELAHKINRDKIPATRPEGHNKDFIEQRADYTAAAIMMPIKEVSAFLKSKKYDEVSSKKRLSIVKDMCKKYNVTEVNALRRIKEVQELERNGFQSGL